ncbi:MAG: hypothetical protein LUD27_03555 [Clostridia bacterium]|nr:hypothetical protein [Clostridia bacterium]
MKKSKNLYKLAKYFFVLLVLLVLSLSVIGSSSSSYVTTATQYGEVTSVTPYVITEEIKISFNKVSKTDSNTYYNDYKYTYSSYSEDYQVRIENYSNIKTYYGDSVDDNISSFIDFYGTTREKGQRGTLTSASNEDLSYTDPLCFESAFDGDNATTLSIASFKTAMTMTVYFGTSSAIDDNDNVFNYNGAKINKTDNGSDITEVGESVSEATNGYYFTDGTTDTHHCYCYQTTVSSGTSMNFTTAMNNVTIYLITLTPVTGVGLANTAASAGSTAAALATTAGAYSTSLTLTATVGTSASANTATVTSSDEGVAVATIAAAANTGGGAVQSSMKLSSAKLTSESVDGTVSDGTCTYTITVEAKGAGVATITFTSGGLSASYDIYVQGAYISGDDSVYTTGSGINLTVKNVSDTEASDVTDTYTWSYEAANGSSGAVSFDSNSGTSASVTGTAAGYVTVKAEYGGNTLTKDITVSDYFKYDMSKGSDGTYGISKAYFFTDGKVSSDSTSTNTNTGATETSILYWYGKANGFSNGYFRTGGETKDNARYFGIDLSNYSDYTVTVEIVFAASSDEPVTCYLSTETSNSSGIIIESDESEGNEVTLSYKGTVSGLGLTDGQLYVTTSGGNTKFYSITILLTPVSGE